jgi:diketogulonate reductase-like aldo/keto reductase
MSWAASLITSVYESPYETSTKFSFRGLEANYYKAAMKLLAEGRARAIGGCNFRANDLNRLVEQTGHVPAVNQVELHPFFNQPDLRKADEKHGIITQAWSRIGGVKRYGAKASKEGVQDPLSHPAVVLLARK